MFLALQEMKKEKGRFLLIISIAVLISYLVYFLLGLAFGLASDNTSAIQKLNAKQIVLAKGSNKNIQSSLIDKQLLEKSLNGKKYSLINLSRSSAYINEKVDEENTIALVIIGTEKNATLMPKLIEGSDDVTENKVVASISLKQEKGLKIGDRLQLAMNDKTFEIIGFSEEAKYNTASVVYTDLSHSSAAYMVFPDKNGNIPEKVSAAVLHEPLDNIDNEKVEMIDIQSFINSIPGYTAQILTFGLMISFLVVISSIVLGVFLYIITIQKKQTFGIMKIQGISNAYISKSVFFQTVIVSTTGLMLGFILTWMTQLLLPTKVPFHLNMLLVMMISGLMLVTSLIGAIFSLRGVAKVDPLEVLG